MPVVVLKPEQDNTVPYYIYADHINTPRVITRANDNAMVWRWDHADPFGATAPDESLAGMEPYRYNLRFPGQLFDAESGLHQNYFRDYDPRTGRYVTSDPIGLQGGINTYAYVEGNPISSVDPLGLASWYCQRPLGKPPGTKGPPLLNHQYICVKMKNGVISCGGLTTNGNSLSGIPRLTTPKEDYYHADSCKEVDDDKDDCFEQCVLTNFAKPNKPRYGIGPLTDCQEYADDLYYGCKIMCNLKKDKR
jgi:RHS repeat-associated protein